MSRRLWGCHGSYSISLPRLQHSRPVTATAAMATTEPLRRRTMAATPITARPFSRATPSARPGAPKSLAGTAHRSNSSGPGLLKLVGVFCDAEVQVPSRGCGW